MSCSKDVISLFDVWDCAQKPHSLSDEQANIRCITSTCKRAEQAFPLSSLGVQLFHWTLHPPQIFPVLSGLWNPHGYEKTPGYIRRRISSGKVMCTGSDAHAWCWCPFFVSAMHLHWSDCPGLATKKRGHTFTRRTPWGTKARTPRLINSVTKATAILS
jgi:hypothetical protein